MAALVSAQVLALAQADFSGIAARFASVGFSVRQPARGILQIGASQRAAPMQLLLSVGVHGDETGPIEMLAHLLDELAAAPQRLALDLMVVVGNLDAIAQGRRFIDADMNRMFRAERGDLATAGEATRADQIMQATEEFFCRRAGGKKWHLDLHTAIRPSRYPTFAIVPDLIADAGKQALFRWMAQAGIGAIVLNPTSAGTYSSWTATRSRHGRQHGRAGPDRDAGPE
ncbi:succinylglutamate desuccinylase [Undibacterium arcticum]